MMVRQNLLIQKNKFYRFVYEDNDKEDMTMQEVRKYWVKPEPDEDKSSSKKNSGRKDSIQLLILKQPKF